jgi:PhzF family phenazine biosynthesis protein
MDILRYVAFSDDPRGGNPAGVVLDPTGTAVWTDAEMQATAAEVGFSETAFLVARAEPRELDTRYFSPLAEVSFCGHVTIASAVAYAERFGPGDIVFHTGVGRVPVATGRDAAGRITATLTSVAPRQEPLAEADLAEILAALAWKPSDLDPAIPPVVAYGGAWHPIIAVGSRARLADLDYDFARLGALMAARGWTTVDLVHRESESVFHARNPFPPGGVVEDPATGAAAAAFGGYLRALGGAPREVTVHQGDDMGRPGALTVGIPADPASGIQVGGTAVVMGTAV